MLNDTDFTTELEVQVTLTQEVANTQKWSTSSTFSTSLTVGFSVGVPEVHSVDGSITVSQQRTVSTEMGSTITEAIQFQTTFKVPQVPPRTEVKVTVECTTARLRVPFTYSSRDIRIDGIDMPTVLDNVDGIFEGVNAFSIRGVVTTVEDNTFRSPTACSPPPLPDTQGHQLFKCAIG
ncbi:hypothetical protein KP509_38G049800 [Ceratopteris richardii]|uniref:Uncharacterized protein n=1 Tax=Ceratopteris richardii TaxID=49495 RepID=A0A8T2Q3W9_CERRI|nr:hypothetical protein KP509_38G049800 [Ceratopteris richardii]